MKPTISLCHFYKFKRKSLPNRTAGDIAKGDNMQPGLERVPEGNDHFKAVAINNSY